MNKCLSNIRFKLGNLTLISVEVKSSLSYLVLQSLLRWGQLVKLHLIENVLPKIPNADQQNGGKYYSYSFHYKKKGYNCSNLLQIFR